MLRFANVLGTDIVTPISHDLRRRILPCIFGFDPLVQFVEEDDVVRALEHVTANRIPGVYNVAGEGKLPWSEVATIGGAYLLPLPPFRPRALRRAADPARPAAVPARDGGTGPLRAGRGHLPAGGDGVRVPLHQRRRRGELRPGQQPAAGHRVGASRSTGTSARSSSSSATPRPSCGRRRRLRVHASAMATAAASGFADS